MVYVIHGLFHTGARWEDLASRIGPDANSVYCPDLPTVNEIARAIAPRLIGADTIIGHFTGGLVLYEMLMNGYIQRPRNVVFVSTPFKGLKKLKKLKPLFSLAKLSKSEAVIQAMARYTVKDPKYVDDIMIRDAYLTMTNASFELLREVTDYNVSLQPIAGSNVFLCEGEYGALVDRIVFPQAHQVLFNNCGHTPMLENSEQFLSFIRQIRGQ